jgi:hypothetical protein
MNGNTSRGTRRPEIGGRVVGRSRQWEQDAVRLERKTSSVAQAREKLFKTSANMMNNYDEKYEHQVLG